VLAFQCQKGKQDTKISSQYSPGRRVGYRIVGEPASLIFLGLRLLKFCLKLSNIVGDEQGGGID
jgi:hypothetical protein